MLLLVQHRPCWQNRQLPLWFRDCLPEAPMPLPPPVVPQADPTSGSQPVSLARVCFWKFKSQMNKFGLYWLYCTVSLPSHDPDDPHSISQPHPDPIVGHDSGGPQNPYHPYLNQNSFHLGEWYWNQGIQKSPESFEQLLNIIGSSDFHPQDVEKMNWKAIDCELCKDSWEHEAEWLDDDNNWQRTPITILAPFHSHNQQSGPKSTGDFHHRSLISIIHKKLTDPDHDRLFHCEPYELLESTITCTATSSLDRSNPGCTRAAHPLHSSHMFLHCTDRLPDLHI